MSYFRQNVPIISDSQFVSVYLLYGKTGNSVENSNGMVHPGGNFPEKNSYLSRYYLFQVFTEMNDQNLLYHLF